MPRHVADSLLLATTIQSIAPLPASGSATGMWVKFAALCGFQYASRLFHKLAEMETQEELIARLRSETEAIRSGVADVVLSWANLENSLALLLQVLMQRNDGLPLKIYFTPNNTETRFRIIEVAIKHLHPPAGLDAECLKKCIEKFMRKLQDAKESRNKIAHWQVVTACDASGKNRVRLATPIFNLNKGPKTIEEARQVPGMGAGDLKGIAEAIQRCSNWSDEFMALFAADPATARALLPQLAQSLKVAVA